MEIRLFQIIVPIVSLIFISSIYVRYSKGKSSLNESLMTGIFWVAVGVFSLVPDTISNVVARLFGIKSNVNAIIFLSIGIMFYLQYMLFNRLKEQEKKLTELTRDLALKDFEEEAS